MAPTPSSLDKRLTHIEEKLDTVLRNGKDDNWLKRLLRRNEVNLVAIATATVWIVRDNTDMRTEIVKVLPTAIRAVDEKATRAIDTERDARISDVSYLKTFCCQKASGDCPARGDNPIYAMRAEERGERVR